MINLRHIFVGLAIAIPVSGPGAAENVRAMHDNVEIPVFPTRRAIFREARFK